MDHDRSRGNLALHERGILLTPRPPTGLDDTDTLIVREILKQLETSFGICRFADLHIR
mgnify:CR=1 FL=1